MEATRTAAQIREGIAWSSVGPPRQTAQVPDGMTGIGARSGVDRT